MQHSKNYIKTIERLLLAGHKILEGNFDNTIMLNEVQGICTISQTALEEVKLSLGLNSEVVKGQTFWYYNEKFPLYN